MMMKMMKMNKKGINLNKYHVKFIMKNINLEEVSIKLPITDRSLEKALIKILLIEKDMLGYENFDTEFMSVLDIVKVDNIKIEKPTNIYYLNLYLNILKEKNINLTSENKVIRTEFLKEEIANLLKSSRKNMDYKELKELMLKENKFSKKELEEKQKTRKNSDNGKLRFTIPQLQRLHNEGKGKNE